MILPTITFAVHPTKSHEKTTINKTSKKLFPDDIYQVLLKKITVLNNLLASPVIQNQIKRSNQQSLQLSLPEIHKIDKKFIKMKANNPFVTSLMKNPCGIELRRFQKYHPGYIEIFVTNKKGMNVCQTNKTSDYYQADEKWWIDSYNKGVGKILFDRIEHDKSSASISIPIYLPVKDPKTNKVIGICKALIPIRAISDEL